QRHAVETGGIGKARLITEKAWAAASRRQLDGTEAWIPVASDAALVGLIAGRSWSGDRYALRPHDLLDLQALMSTAGFGLAQLMERAEELGMARTTKLDRKSVVQGKGVVQGGGDKD